MAVKSYKYNDKTQLTKHFKVSEWKCKCGKNHDIKIDEKMPILLENLLVKLGAAHGNIYSGYRCPEHDKKVGGSGKGPHTLGMGVDMRFVDSKGKPIKSSTVALTLEDMGHKYGIGYRSGSSSDASGNIHIDTKNRKWYGDESISHSLAIWQIKKGAYSFYDYLGIKKEKPKLITPVSRDSEKDQIEVLINDLNLRDDANGKVLGLVPKGIYNVLDEINTDGYLWVKLDEKKWIATKEGNWTKCYESEENQKDDELTNDKIDEEIIDNELLEDEVSNNEQEENNNQKLSIWQRIINFFRNLFKR